MTSKNLYVMVGVAVVLGVAAYFVGNGAKGSAPKLNGKPVLPGFNAADVARIAEARTLPAASGRKEYPLICITCFVTGEHSSVYSIEGRLSLCTII